MKIPHFLTLPISVIILSLLLSACGPSPSASIAKSDLARVISRNTPNDVQTLVNNNNAFALDLYQSLRSQGGNLVYSPYSISLALAMTYAGARGQTESQMSQALHFLPQDQLHSAFNALDLQLAERGESPSPMRKHRSNLTLPMQFGPNKPIRSCKTFWIPSP